MNGLRTFCEDLAGRWDGIQPPYRGEMLRRARQRCPDAHHPRFAALGFDLVVCHNSFAHIQGSMLLATMRCNLDCVRTLAYNW